MRFDAREYFCPAFNFCCSSYFAWGIFFSSYSVLVRKIILVLVLVHGKAVTFLLVFFLIYENNADMLCV